MQPTLGCFISLANMNAAARIQCLQQVRRVADHLRQHHIIAHIDRAIASDRKTIEMNARWRLRHWRGQSRPEFAQLDARLRALLVGLRETANAHIHGEVVGDRLRRAAENVLVTVFPHGIDHITTLPYAERLFAIERIVDLLVNDLSDDIAALALTRSTLELCEVAERYHKALSGCSEVREFAPVALAREGGQDRLFELLAMILATFAGDDQRSPADVRAELLAPLMLEDDAVRSQYRKRDSRAVEAA